MRKLHCQNPSRNPYRWRYRLGIVGALAALLSLIACQKPQSAAAPDAGTPATESLVQTSESGPVRVSLSLQPKKPRLGDPLTLTLTVDAQPGVQVEMPPFGEALGRFAITSFTPRSETKPDGSSQHSQRYVLEAPMSGRQRIPSLRVEFTDQRPAGGTWVGSLPDAGSDSSHEVLTDELAIEIASVLPDEKDTELRGLRAVLDESVGANRYWIFAAVPAAALGLVLLAWILRRLRTRAALQVRISAYDRARSRMTDLERRGWPGQGEADAWYVELSDIVRRYIEDRFGVRAPELTTEEFLREAQARLRLQPAQRQLLEAFLATCDRVKFAGYRPGATESQQAFEAASRFLADTQLSEANAPGGGQA